MTSSYVAFDPDMLHSPLPFGIQANWQGSVGYAQNPPTVLIPFGTLLFRRLCGAPSRCAIRGSCRRSSSSVSSMPLWRTSTKHDRTKAFSNRFQSRKLDHYQHILQVARSSPSPSWVGYITTTDEVHTFFTNS